MPEGPGAEVCEVLERANVTSSSIISAHCHTSKAGGLSGWKEEMGVSVWGKNLVAKVAAFCSGL
jgi:hypothetical protein